MNLAETLKKAYLFHDLSQPQLDAVAQVCTLRKYPHGKVIFTQGKKNEHLFLIQSGQVKISVRDEKGNERALSFLGPGNSFGEMSLITNEFTSSDVTPLIDTEVVMIHKKDFLPLLQTIPSIAIKMSCLLSERLKKTNLLQNLKQQETGLTTFLFSKKELACGVKSAVSVGNFLAKEFKKKVVLVLTDAGISKEPLTTKNCDTLVLKNKKDSHLLSDLYSQYDQILVLTASKEDLAQSPFCHQAQKMISFLPLSQKEAALSPTVARALFQEKGDLSEIHKLRKTFKGPLFIFPSGVTQAARFIMNKTFGIVLGGGGARGFAHIGVMRALEKQNLLPDAYCGSSMGGIIASFYAQGLPTQEIIEIIREHAMKKGNKFDFRFPFHSLIKGKKLEVMAKTVYGDKTFDDLVSPLYLVCADLISGEEVILNQGLLRTAVYASCDLPGIMPPVAIDNKYLIDGSILNKVPTSVLKERGYQHVLAVNVTPKRDRSFLKKPNILKIISRSFELINYKLSYSVLGPQDILIEPQLGNFEFFGFNAIDKIIDQGEASAEKAIAQFKKILYS